MTRNDVKAAIKDVAAGAGESLETAMTKLYEKMSEKEVAELASFNFGLHPGRLAKTLLMAVVAETIDNEFNAETIKPGVRKARKIAKIDRAPYKPKPYEEGILARNQGKPQRDNPYEIGTTERGEWSDGWLGNPSPEIMRQLSDAQKKAIDGAVVVQYDETRQVVLSFDGGMVVRGFDKDGTQVAYWKLPTWTTGRSYPQTARESMLKAVESGKYPAH